MGAWGVGAFDNDDAADWLEVLQTADNEAVLKKALETVQVGESYLEAPEAIRMLCSCEIIAALLGQAALNLPEQAREWVEQHSSLNVSPLVSAGKKGIDRVLAEESELDELWSESKNDYQAWRSSILDLKNRLNGRRGVTS